MVDDYRVGSWKWWEVAKCGSPRYLTYVGEHLANVANYPTVVAVRFLAIRS